MESPAIPTSSEKRKVGGQMSEGVTVGKSLGQRKRDTWAGRLKVKKMEEYLCKEATRPSKNFLITREIERPARTAKRWYNLEQEHSHPPTMPKGRDLEKHLPPASNMSTCSKDCWVDTVDPWGNSSPPAAPETSFRIQPSVPRT